MLTCIQILKQIAEKACYSHPGFGEPVGTSGIYRDCKEMVAIPLKLSSQATPVSTCRTCCPYLVALVFNGIFKILF